MLDKKSVRICIQWNTQLYLTLCNPWTVACQAPLSMEFSRQEYWSGLPFPSLGDLPKPGIEPRSSALQADFLPSEPLGKPLMEYYSAIKKNKVLPSATADGLGGHYAK